MEATCRARPATPRGARSTASMPRDGAAEGPSGSGAEPPAPCALSRPARDRRSSLSSAEMEQAEIEAKRREVQIMLRRNRRYMDKMGTASLEAAVGAVPTPARARRPSPARGGVAPALASAGCGGRGCAPKAPSAPQAAPVGAPTPPAAPVAAATAAAPAASCPADAPASATPAPVPVATPPTELPGPAPAASCPAEAPASATPAPVPVAPPPTELQGPAPASSPVALEPAPECPGPAPSPAPARRPSGRASGGGLQAAAAAAREPSPLVRALLKAPRPPALDLRRCDLIKHDLQG
ncbi:unnamed protein product [Prorocentrum cordatum]|uniref:Uncharacterized protein n=1 Tax=Prorocentrum cordatum TaxID=2364126 RepID=A0ABN9X7D7_9DINO|nr:unnamed protein product [Polarella glacialis]